MRLVILTAFGVGGATALGAVIGYFFKGCSLRFSNSILAFSSGVMLAATFFGLVQPAVESGKSSLFAAISGLFFGAISMDVIGKLIASVTPKDFKNTKILLFILAITIHNFPEGIASGLGFGTGDITNALMIAGGIALQNIPEGMVVIAPMVSVGISPRRALFYAVLTGLVEIFGTLIGYLAITVTKALLPFLLAFAAGTMLYIICGEMIPEICKENNKDNMYCLLFGFSFMLTLSVLV